MSRYCAHTHAHTDNVHKTDVNKIQINHIFTYFPYMVVIFSAVDKQAKPHFWISSEFPRRYWSRRAGIEDLRGVWQSDQLMVKSLEASWHFGISCISRATSCSWVSDMTYRLSTLPVLTKPLLQRMGGKTLCRLGLFCAKNHRSWIGSCPWILHSFIQT